MIPAELEKLIIRHKSEGHLPFFVNCTTGTTVYGAFDPIEPIADICEKYGIWLHIDVSRENYKGEVNLPLPLLNYFTNVLVTVTRNLTSFFTETKSKFIICGHS